MSSRIVPIASLLIVGAGAAVFRARSESERLYLSASQAPVPLRLRAAPSAAGAGSNDFRYAWFDDAGEAHEVARVAEIPPARRDFVRATPVVSARAVAGEVLLADLEHPRVDGSLPLRRLSLDRFSAELAALSGHRWTRRRGDPRPREAARHVDPMPVRLARRNTAAPAGVETARAEGPPRPIVAEARATIYGASWCGACRAAKQWLRREGVPFAERDIEAEPGARDAMEGVCAREGLACTGIPVIEARGRAMVGFDPQALGEMLGR
jgi:glutaredoxin